MEYILLLKRVLVVQIILFLVILNMPKITGKLLKNVKLVLVVLVMEQIRVQELLEVHVILLIRLLISQKLLMKIV